MIKSNTFVKTTGMQQPAFHKVLIYDDNCPLCKAYTSAFVRAGFLQEENRIAFSQLNGEEFTIDWNRAKHEIPLVDRETKNVVYGVDALTTILQQKFRFIGWGMKIKPVYWFFKKLYKLVSYNRRLIVAHHSSVSCGVDCRPDFNLKYRSILLVLLMAISCTMLATVARLYAFPVNTETIFYAMILPLFIMLFGRSRLLDIGSHFAIIAVIASFLVLFTAIAEKIFPGPDWLVSGAGLAVTTIIIFKQVIQRIRFVKENRINEMHCYQ